ncbi:MAG: guanylate kinase [Hyphomicrobiaceae bacterium]|nr:guanylate kinase [Hyphomicrobiaceae bacterium]
MTVPAATTANRTLPPRRGLLLVLSSPSGAGKTTLAKRLLTEDPGLKMSVSVTTRPPRPGEVDGVDYHFIDDTRFREMVADGALLEWARVFDHSYGTPKAPVTAALDNGGDVLFDIDWQGARQLAASLPDDLVRVFILPPTGRALQQRLIARNQDGADVVARRMAKAADEIAHWADYDYVVVNTEVESSLVQLRAILGAERCRRERQPGLAAFVGGLQAELDGLQVR